MGITIIPADGPTFYEAFADHFGRSYEGAADRYQRDKATRIQEALHRDQLTQQQKQFEATQARLKAQQEAETTWRREQAAAQQSRYDASKADADARRAEADTKDRQKEQAQAETLARQRDYIAKNRPQDLEYFNAFGRLPGQPHSYQTDPETHALEQQRRMVESEWAKAAKGLKDASSELDGSPKPGKEREYQALRDRIARLEAARAQLDAQLYQRYGRVNGGVNVDSPFQPSATPSGPAAQPGQPAIEDLNVPLPAGVSPFNPQGGVPGKPAPVPAQPVPQAAVPQPAAPAPQAMSITPEQARNLLDTSAAKMGKRPDLIQQMPPAPMSKVAEIKALALRQHSDPIAARQLFYDLMILNGFNPLAAPVPDEQYNMNPGGRVDVRVLE